MFSGTPHDNHLTNYNVGACAIYAVSRDFNLMLETLAGWNEDIAEDVLAFLETVERSTTAIISPGARYAFNLPNDAQLVVGAVLPNYVSPQIPPISACFFTAHSSIRSYEPEIAQQNNVEARAVFHLQANARDPASQRGAKQRNKHARTKVTAD